MYYRRVSTAFVFIVLFTMIELIFASIAWKSFGKNMWDKLNEAFSTTDEIISEEDLVVDGTTETVEESEIPSRYNTDDDDDYLTED
jgi:hypothetical protein